MAVVTGTAPLSPPRPPRPRPPPRSGVELAASVRLHAVVEAKRRSETHVNVDADLIIYIGHTRIGAALFTSVRLLLDPLRCLDGQDACHKRSGVRQLSDR